MRTLALLAVLLASSPALAKGHARKAAPSAPAAPAPGHKEPLECWLEAEDKMASGDAPAALDSLRQALAEIHKRATDSKIAGPAGALWSRAEALYRYTLRAGDVAMQVSFREAAPLYEAAAKLAIDKATRTDAELKLEAARANLAAGKEKASSFLGDDLGGEGDDPTSGQP